MFWNLFSNSSGSDPPKFYSDIWVPFSSTSRPTPMVTPGTCFLYRTCVKLPLSRCPAVPALSQARFVEVPLAVSPVCSGLSPSFLHSVVKGTHLDFAEAEAKPSGLSSLRGSKWGSEWLCTWSIFVRGRSTLQSHWEHWVSDYWVTAPREMWGQVPVSFWSQHLHHLTNVQPYFMCVSVLKHLL